jgi:hypothetical protein
MAIHQLENWAWKSPDNVSNGDIFILCNFVQYEPDTDIFAGKANLKFIRCNLTNVKTKPSFKHESSLVARIEYDTETSGAEPQKYIKNVSEKSNVDKLTTNEFEDILYENEITNEHVLSRYEKKIKEVKEKKEKGD